MKKDNNKNQSFALIEKSLLNQIAGGRGGANYPRYKED